MTPQVLAAEPVILARLQAELPAGAGVHAAPRLEDLEDLKERPRRLPAVYLMYLGGTSPDDARAPAAGLRLREEWAVIVATQDFTRVEEGAAARAAGGELADAVIGALHGWRPLARLRPLRCDRILPPLYDAGLSLIPIIFTHESARRAATD